MKSYNGINRKSYYDKVIGFSFDHEIDMKPLTVGHTISIIMIKISAGEEISFLDKFLGDDSILDLCEKLEITPKKRLVLRGNQLSSNGAQAISQLISSQNALDFLSLEWNHVGSSGAIYLAEALKSNSSLTHLDLRNNRVENDAALALAESLELNDYLRKLDLRWNNVCFIFVCVYSCFDLTISCFLFIDRRQRCFGIQIRYLTP